AADGGDTPDGARRLQRSWPTHPGRLPHTITPGTGQRLARAVPAGARGDDTFVRRSRSAGAGRGGAHPRRIVPQRPPDARRQPGPTGGAVDAVRPAPLVLSPICRRPALAAL